MKNFPLSYIWKSRHLIFYFSLFIIKSKFRGSYLGYFWNAIEPLLVFVLLYFVFTSIRIMPSSFAIYLLTGILFYHIFTRGTIQGMNILKTNRGIIQSLNVKRELIIATSMMATTILMIIEVGVFFGLAPFMEFTPSETLILLPLVFFLLLTLILGLTFILSIVSIYIRDIQPIWAIILQAVFFASPIFWYLADISNSTLLFIQHINPIGQIIEIAHKLIIFNDYPSLTEWLLVTGEILLILLIGYFIFKKYENKIVEEF